MWVMDAMSKIDEVWASLDGRRGQSADEIARRISLPAEYVKDVLIFFARYGFAEIVVNKDGTARVRSREGAPPLTTAIGIIRELACPNDQKSKIKVLDLR
jgi:hypothetical protein